MGIDYNKFRIRLDIQRELIANRYLLNAILVNIFAIEDRLREKEKLFERVMSARDKQKLKQINKSTEVITFDNFELPMVQYQALCNTYSPEVVTDAVILLDRYIKTNAKPLKSYYNKLKTLCDTLKKKQQLKEHFNQVMGAINSLDYTEIETKEQAQAYIAGLPSHLKNIDKGAEELRQRFNLN